MIFIISLYLLIIIFKYIFFENRKKNAFDFLKKLNLDKKNYYKF